MKKTKIIVALLMIMVMSMSFILTACPTESEDPAVGAKGELKTLYDTLLAEYDYTDANRATLKSIYDTAVAAIDATDDAVEIATLLATAKADLDGVARSAKEYTLNDYAGAKPSTWNPHNWQTNADSGMMAYIEMGFVDIAYKSEGVYEWVYEMATSVVDVTANATPAEIAKWGIKEGETGRMWKITLNPNAKWDNGDIINANSYIYSMQQLLNLEMRNYRSDLYRVGESAVYNANYYYLQDMVGEIDWQTIVDSNGAVTVGDDFDEELLVVWNEYHPWLEDTPLDFLNWFKSTYPSYANVIDPVLAFYNEGDESIVIDGNDALKEAWDACLAPFGGTWECAVFYNNGEIPVTTWEDVGLYKGANDYELYYVTTAEISEYYFFISMSSTWLVHEATYEAGKQKQGDLIVTNYNTSLATSRAYGVYKLSSFEVNSYSLVRNDQWYGWTDGNHEGQYQTTKINVQILTNQSTILQMFNKGELDGVSLEAADMDTYRASDYLMKTPEPYTMRFFFNADPAVLAKLDSDRGDANKSVQILQYTEFRKAMSLAFNREEWTRDVTAGDIPAAFLINSMYMYDVENNPDSVYRNTRQAKEALTKAYGTYDLIGSTYANLDEAYEATIGYDLAAAKASFTAAYNKAKADGTYKDGQMIEINVGAAKGSVTSALSAQEAKFNSFLAAATEGTPLAGKVTVKYIYDINDRYGDVRAGVRECGYGAVGGAVFYVYRHFNSYLSPKNGVGGIIMEGGFDPENETLTLTLDFGKGVESKTKTYEQWTLSLNEGGEFYLADHEVKLNILGALEQEILELCYTFPISVSASVSMYSQKISYITLNYNVMYGYGGIRFMSYNYSDVEWAAYVASQGGTLSYT